jgi:hypothetical protein
MAGTMGPRIPGSKGNGGKRTEIKLRLPQQIAPGVYANGMVVQHSSEEFVLDFTMVVGGAGTVVARVITSPPHAKAMVAALQENLRRYEGSYGSIRSPGPRPRPGMGFQPEAEEDE